MNGERRDAAADDYLYTCLDPSQAPHFTALALPQFQSRLHKAGEDLSLVSWGAHAFNLPLGLVLAELPAGATNAELLSIFVRERQRRRGVGTRLLHYLERHVAARGARSLRVLYEAGRPYTAALEGFLARTGFSPAERYAVSCRCLFDRMREAPWLERVPLPASFELFPWRELRPEERARVVESQRASAWFPEELSPFAREATLEPVNSLGLRYRGDVVGWQINHRVAPDTIQYSITFVREDLQPLGLGVLLMVESTRRQVFGEDARLDKAYFRVPLAMTGMIRYVERRLRPYVDEMNDCLRASKQLAAPEAS